MKENKLYAHVLVKNGRDILLGFKKRGFGQGKWDSFGGKVETNEKIEEAVKREVKEECGLDVDKLEKVGLIHYEFKGDPVITEVHVFLTDRFSGTVTESEEMRPKWFSEQEIPFDLMRADEKHWLPKVLQGKKLKAHFLYEGHETILSYNIDFVASV